MMVPGQIVGIAAHSGVMLKRSLSFKKREGAGRRSTPPASELASSESAADSEDSEHAFPGLTNLSRLQGTLLKRCHTTKRWVSRYLEVDDQRGLLLYFSCSRPPTASSPCIAAPSRVYLLQELTAVTPLSLANKWAFELSFAGGRKLLCNCESEADEPARFPRENMQYPKIFWYF